MTYKALSSYKKISALSGELGEVKAIPSFTMREGIVVTETVVVELLVTLISLDNLREHSISIPPYVVNAVMLIQIYSLLLLHTCLCIGIVYLSTLHQYYKNTFT